MPPKSLRAQLNQIRAWVRQGRTDAWIAHQLEVSASELRDFRRQHGLSPDDDDAGSAEVDLRDEIEAEIEAAGSEEVAEDTDEEVAEDGSQEESDGSEAEGPPRRRRRRGRRGGRGRRPRRALEATFDHGEDGIGLWLDPAVQDNPNYSEHWAGHREVTVTIEPEQIVIRRSGSDEPASNGNSDSDSDD
ncbi:MAG TPA: hypothetical protein VIL53_00915 [Solirubrobacterales bacterium]|jgi:hypothetical protein